MAGTYLPFKAMVIYSMYVDRPLVLVLYLLSLSFCNRYSHNVLLHIVFLQKYLYPCAVLDCESES